MKACFVAATFLAVLALPAAALAAQALEDMPGVRQLHWVVGVRTLPVSGAILTVPANAKLLIDPDVRKLQGITGSNDATAEAELRLTRVGTIEYEFCNCGFTLTDDWSCVNADEVADSIARYYTAQGWDEVVGFARSPRFDRARAMITYLLHLRNDTRGDYFEGDALVFGRNGYETLVAGTRKGDADGTWAALQTAIGAFHFPSGHAYGDYQTGDKTSANHVAAQFAEKAGADDLVERYFYTCETQRT